MARCACAWDHHAHFISFTYLSEGVSMKLCYNVIMILESHGTSHIHNHLANSAGMRKSGPVKTGPTGVVDIPLLLELTPCDGIKLESQRRTG